MPARFAITRSLRCVTLSVAVPRPDYYGNPASLTEEVDVVRAIYAAFAARDIDGALDFVSPECEIHVEATARAAGRNGPYRGHDGLRRYFADVKRVWSELTLEADDYRTVPGSVVVMGTVSGHDGETAIRRRVLWTWKLRDNLAVMVRVADLGEG
jgi:ketosteroid isomerase-like protein